MTREDPSGLWSFAGLGAKIGSYFGSAGARIGASLGSIVDYGIGYATGWGGGGGYSGYGYSGGGYGFSGNTAGRKAKQAVKAAAPVAPPEPAWKRNGPKSTSRIETKPKNTPNSGFQGGQKPYLPSDPESFEGGKKIAEGIHWAHANIEAPAFMATWIYTGFAAGAALEIACAPSLVGIAACAPASGVLIGGGAGLGYSEYRIWEGSDTHRVAAWVWDKTPTSMSPAKMLWELF